MQRYHFWRCSVYVQNALQLASWLDMSLIRSVFSLCFIKYLKIRFECQTLVQKNIE